MIEFSHGSVNRRTWKYCDKHNRMITKNGSPTSCAADVCAGKKRERHEFCFTYMKDGKTLRARGQAATRDEALEAMQARKDELAKEPETPTPAPVTLNEYADRWLVEIASSVEPRTVESYRGMLKNHVRPSLGALPLPSITRGQVKSLLAKKREAGLSKDTVRLIRAAISALFSDAVDSELAPSNPAAKVGHARGRKSPDSVSTSERRQNIKAMSAEQLDTFLKAAPRERLGLLFLFLADTGVRPGEAFALRWPDVDLVGRQVHITRAIARGKRIKDTKTNTDRYVDLTPRLAKALDVYQTEIEKKALETGREAPDVVFPSDAGTPFDDINVGKKFKALLVRAGLPKQFSLYTLRHTFASHLFALNAPITYVANQMGHSKPTTTLQFYAHFLPSGDRALADRLEAWRSEPASPRKAATPIYS
jgi:integrase